MTKYTSNKNCRSKSHSCTVLLSFQKRERTFAKLLNHGSTSTNQRTKNFHNQNILRNRKRAADTFCLCRPFSLQATTSMQDSDNSVIYTLHDCRIYLHATDQSKRVKQPRCIIIFINKPSAASLQSLSGYIEMTICLRILLLELQYQVAYNKKNNR